MHHAFKLIAAAALALAMPLAARADVTVTAPNQSTSGTYMDYMKTVYQRAGSPELIMLPLTAFDSEFNLQPMGAKSWKQSADGLTWTFTLQDNLVWSDGDAADRRPTMSSPSSAPPRKATISTGTGRSRAASRAGRT